MKRTKVSQKASKKTFKLVKWKNNQFRRFLSESTQETFSNNYQTDINIHISIL